MAKEKPEDPDRAARKAEKKAKKEKRSETDGVHKPSKKEKKPKDKAIDVDKENVETTTKLLNTLEAEKPGTVVMKEGADGEMEVKVKTKPLLGALVPFAHPLADEKVGKKVLKCVKKGILYFLLVLKLPFLPLSSPSLPKFPEIRYHGIKINQKKKKKFPPIAN